MLSVVMPAHNEEGYLGPAVKAVVAGLGSSGEPFEIIVVENGSSDATADEAATLAASLPAVTVLRLPLADYGAALRTGLLAASGDVVVNFDVDLVDLDFLERALPVLDRQDCAIVVGSKRLPGAEDRRGAGRRLITATFSAVMRIGFGLSVSDTHGLKALRRQPLVALAEQCRFGKDIFDTELILRAERAGLRVAEIPVTVDETRPARSSILRRIPRTLVGLARLRIALPPGGRR